MVQSIKVVTNHSIGTCSLDYIVYILKLRELKGYMRLRSRLKRMSKPQNATNVKHSRKGAARESFARGLKPNSSVVNCCGGLGSDVRLNSNFSLSKSISKPFLDSLSSLIRFSKLTPPKTFGSFSNHHFYRGYYCWWKKSPTTTWYARNPVNNGGTFTINTMLNFRDPYDQSPHYFHGFVPEDFGDEYPLFQWILYGAPIGWSSIEP